MYEEKSQKWRSSGCWISGGNSAILGLVGIYALLLFYPQAIGNIHARVIISQFVIFTFPGFFLYNLAFARQDHDIFEKLTFFFLLSCFVFLVTGSVAYYFRLPLLFYMKCFLFLFLIGTSILLYQNLIDNKPESTQSRNNILNLFILFLTGILVYLFTTRGVKAVGDSSFHIGSMVKIADSGIITPDDPFVKGYGPWPGYLYSPYHLMLAVIKKLSASPQHVVWHHLPKVILFFIPTCYYSLAKSVFNDKRIAYYSYFIMVGLYFTGYFELSICFPFPRRFERELLIPIFYIFLFRYFRSLEKKDMIALVISSMVVVMYHSMGIPFIFFNSLLFLLLLFVFKDTRESIRKRLVAFVAIAFANLPYLIGIVKNMSPVKTISHFPKYILALHITEVTPNMFIIKNSPFFSIDSWLCYIVVVLLILTQSNSVPTLIMMAALLVGPVFLYFPPFATGFSQIFSPGIMSRLRDINITPFFCICFLVIISFYGIKYLERLREKQKTIREYFLGIIFLTGITYLMWTITNISIKPFLPICFLIFLSLYGIKYFERLRGIQKTIKGYFLDTTFLSIGIAFLIWVNTHFITQYFWIKERTIGGDLAVISLTSSFTSEILLIMLVVVSIVLFFYFNKNKSFDAIEPFSLNSVKKSHLSAVLFIPLAFSTIYVYPEIRESVCVTQQIDHPNLGDFILDKDYIPKLYKYITSNEKPRSVNILMENRKKGFELCQFIPQFVLYGRNTSQVSADEMMRIYLEVIGRILDDEVPLDETLDLINENDVDYILVPTIRKKEGFLKNKFKDENLFQRLLKEKIIIRDILQPNNPKVVLNDGRIAPSVFNNEVLQHLIEGDIIKKYGKRYVRFIGYFGDDEGRLRKHLEIIGIEDIESVLEIWRNTYNVRINDLIQLRERLEKAGISKIDQVLNIWREPKYKKFAKYKKYFKLVYKEECNFLYKVLSP